MVKLTIINKHFMAVHDSGSSRIEPNIYEVAKAFCLASARGLLSKHLPYSNGVIDYRYEECAPDLFKWYYALTGDNSPGKVGFRSNPNLFFKLVEPLDFSKPYDPQLVESIRSQFLSSERKIEALDAEDIELGDEQS